MVNYTNTSYGFARTANAPGAVRDYKTMSTSATSTTNENREILPPPGSGKQYFLWGWTHSTSDTTDTVYTLSGVSDASAMVSTGSNRMGHTVMLAIPRAFPENSGIGVKKETGNDITFWTFYYTTEDVGT
tara:strand:- start:16 stop:405 length:390 start_codon:yes stop_codon:yes gene_type:complete